MKLRPCKLAPGIRFLHVITGYDHTPIQKALCELGPWVILLRVTPTLLIPKLQTKSLVSASSVPLFSTNVTYSFDLGPNS